MCLSADTAACSVLCTSSSQALALHVLVSGVSVRLLDHWLQGGLLQVGMVPEGKAPGEAFF